MSCGRVNWWRALGKTRAQGWQMAACQWIRPSNSTRSTTNASTANPCPRRCSSETLHAIVHRPTITTLVSSQTTTVARAYTAAGSPGSVHATWGDRATSHRCTLRPPLPGAAARNSSSSSSGSGSSRMHPASPAAAAAAAAAASSPAGCTTCS